MSEKISVQLVQLNYKYGDQVYLPYSVGVLQTFVKQKKEIREKIVIVHNANDADYITNNYTDWRGETMPTKFVVPKNFKIMYEIKVDDVTINTIYKKY